MLKILSRNLHLFWQRAPALETSFYLLLGAGFCLSSILFFLFLSLLFLSLKGYALLNFKEKYTFISSSTLLILLGFLYTHYFNLPIFEEGATLTGNALIKITEKRPSTFFGKTSLYYKANILIFESHDHVMYKNIPCSFNLKPKDAITANKDYYLKNINLLSKAPRRFQIKFQKTSQMTPIEKTSSLVEWRYLQKLKAEKHLSTYIKEPKVLKFLSTLTLGYLDNKTMNYEFSKVGLQHLLTISGFHFALLALSLSFLLKPFLPKKILNTTLIVALSLYVVYLGPSPSVSRAWIAILIYLIAQLFEIQSSGLNAIGIACLVSFLDNPISITHIGFQLSYLATFGIVAFYEPCEKWFCVLIPQRPLAVAIQMPLYQKLCYHSLVIIRKALALDLAVNTMTIPIIFYEFGNFPVFSFFYNLLIPFLMTGTLFLLLLGFIFSFFKPLCVLIHHLNDLYTNEILSLISYAPKGLEISIYIPNLSLYLTIISLCATFLFILYFKKLSK